MYENRRRVHGRRGKDLQKLRSERTERRFAHLYETGGMRRTHLRKRSNILKRLLIHAVGFNLALGDTSEVRNGQAVDPARGFGPALDRSDRFMGSICLIYWLRGE